MDISGLPKNKSNEEVVEKQESLELNKETIEKLDRSFQELAKKSHEATVEEVQNLSLFVKNVKEQVENESSPYFRFFSGLKNMGLLLKIKAFERQLETLQACALKNKERLNIQRAIWDLQKKGLILPLGLEATKEAFRANVEEMEALGCNLAFTFIINNRDEGLLDLLTYSIDGTLDCRTVSVRDVPTLPVGVPLSQLQEVANWLQVHGQVTLLSTKAIEEKLSKLMNSCPHGAYVLHTADNALTLSRLTPAGKISHLKIDLQKQLGCYTLELQGKEIAATRLEFKRRLEQSGTPVRLKVQEE
jgi:hypothetical protein